MRAYQRIAIGLMCATAGYNSRLEAQQAPGGPATEQGDVLFFHQAVPPPGEGTFGMRLQDIGPMVNQAVTEAMSSVGPAVNEAVSAMTQAFAYVSAVGPGSGKIIISAPFSAEASTEIVQTLADGNRITRKLSATLARDRQGRTRRDQTGGAMGPFVTTGTAPNISFITDPVAKVQYVLDHKSKTAIQSPGPMPMPPLMSLPDAPPGLPMEGMGMVKAFPFSAPVTESLGKQTIEGVETDGTRSTSTIAAGTIGNDLPIHIFSERWYSPALQEVIVSTHSDPRMGKTTYRLTGINRNEPDHSVFEVPPDYTLLSKPSMWPQGFAYCVAAGNPVAESLPRTCRTADGKTYIEPPPAGSGPHPFNIPLPTR